MTTENQNREAFIQDLATLKWKRTSPCGTLWHDYYYALIVSQIYILRVYDRDSAYLTTTEDTTFQFVFTVDEARRILGKVV